MVSQFCKVFEHESHTDDREEDKDWKDNQCQHTVCIGPIILPREVKHSHIDEAADKADNITFNDQTENSTPKKLIVNPIGESFAAFDAGKLSDAAVKDVIKR